MDLNQLYFDHQILMMKADGAPHHASRDLHEMRASQIAGRIGCMQRALGASAAPVWEGLAIAELASLACPTRHLQGYAS